MILWRGVIKLRKLARAKSVQKGIMIHPVTKVLPQANSEYLVLCSADLEFTFRVVVVEVATGTVLMDGWIPLPALILALEAKLTIRKGVFEDEELFRVTAFQDTYRYYTEQTLLIAAGILVSHRDWSKGFLKIRIGDDASEEPWLFITFWKNLEELQAFKAMVENFSDEAMGFRDFETTLHSRGSKTHFSKWQQSRGRQREG